MEGSVQVALTNGVQTLAIVVGILINDSMLKKFRAHMDDRFDQMQAKWRSEVNRPPAGLDERPKKLGE